MLKNQIARTILGRLGRALSVGFWVMVISFAIMRIIPGDPASARLGGVEAEAIADVGLLGGLLATKALLGL